MNIVFVRVVGQEMNIIFVCWVGQEWTLPPRLSGFTSVFGRGSTGQERCEVELRVGLGCRLTY